MNWFFGKMGFVNWEIGCELNKKAGKVIMKIKII